MQITSPAFSADSNAGSLAAQAARRPLARRQSAYEAEVRKLLDAGLEVMRRSGTESSPKVADIVREAGLSNQAFYRHFASKDEFVAAIMEAGLHRLVGYLRHQMGKEAEPSGQIRRWVEGIMAQAANPAVAEATRAVLWNGRQLPSQVGGRTRPTQILLAGLLDEPLRAAGSADPERDALTVFEAVMGRMQDLLWRQTRPTPADIAHLVHFCLSGIRAERLPGRVEA